MSQKRSTRKHERHWWVAFLGMGKGKRIGSAANIPLVNIKFSNHGSLKSQGKPKQLDRSQRHVKDDESFEQAREAKV